MLELFLASIRDTYPEEAENVESVLEEYHAFRKPQEVEDCLKMMTGLDPPFGHLAFLALAAMRNAERWETYCTEALKTQGLM